VGLLRRAINTADASGRRWLLSAAANAVTTLRNEPLHIRHDGAYWLYSSRGMTLPWGRQFTFYDYDLRTLAGRVARYKSETEDCWFHLYRPKQGDVIVDVGAELGTDTVAFSRAVGPSGRVIAIEAQPETYEMLLKTIEANGLTNVLPLCLAVADKPGEVFITAGEGTVANYLSDQGERVAADTLDNILCDVPRIDFLKMNIEGAEQLAIKGMDETIAKTACIAIACHDFVDQNNEWFQTIEKVESYLRFKGFEVSRRENDERDYVRHHLHATIR
jgi:FkbM family methyltransferase